MRQGEREKEKRMGGVDTGGIVRPRESSPQKQKQLWVCTHSEVEISRCAHTHAHTHPRHTTTINTTPAEKSFGCILAARGVALDAYHVRQVLSQHFLFFKT